MSIIKHVTLQKIVAHDFRYDRRISQPLSLQDLLREMLKNIPINLVIMAVTDVTPCSRVEIYSGFGGNICFCLQGGMVLLKMDGYRRRCKQQFPFKA